MHFYLVTTKVDYKSWANGLKKAGYATDPKYPTKLISTIEKYNLAQYDTDMGIIALNETESTDLQFESTSIITAKEASYLKNMLLVYLKRTTAHML